MSKTFDQIVYESTATEIIESLAESLMESKPADATYSSISGIDKAVSEVEFSESIRKMYLKYHTREGNSSVGVSSRLSNMMIMKVGRFDMSVTESVEMASEILKSAGEKFYGILLSTDNSKSPTGKRMTFNPLHPVIASEIMEEGSHLNMDEKIWTLNVFAWDDKFDQKKKITGAFNEENYIEDIANVLAAMSKKSLYSIKNSNVRAAVEENRFVINYDQKKYHISNGKEVKDEGNGRRNWIVPLQILNNGGIAYPYYGSVYTKNGIAWNLTPMQSANVSRPSEGSSRFENGGRICTRSGDSKTIKGVSALNHSNLTSPLNSNCFRTGSLTYAHQAMLAGLEIITGESLTGNPSIEKPDTFKEFMEKNPKGNAKTYLIYMRDFVSGAKLHDEADIAEAQLAQADLRAEEPVYAAWAAGVNYQTGDIVDDRIGFNDNDAHLRQLTATGWVDYIPPIDLTTIDTVLPGPAEPTVLPEPEADPAPWIGAQAYHNGDLVTRRGWIYQGRREDGQFINEEPTAFATYWTRVRQMQQIIPQEVA